MKFYIYLFFLLFMFCSLTSAQKQSVKLNPNMLAHSQGLLNDLLLFSPDTSVQVLFNPARAALSERRFIYLNYLPYSGTTLSVAALFDAAGSTWLLQASNSVSRITTESASEYHMLDEYLNYTPPIQYLEDRMSTSTTQSYSCSNELKLSWIGEGENDPYSIGAFFILSPQELNSTYSNNEVDIVEYPPSYLYRRIGTYNNTRRSQTNNSYYSGGLEFTMAGPDYDFISSIYVHKNKSEGSATNSYLSSYAYRSGLDTVISSTNSYSSEMYKTTEPIVYNMRIYYQRSASLVTPDDHYFISSYAYYSDGHIFNGLCENRINIYWHDDSYSVSQNDDTLITRIYKEQRSIDYGLTLSTGYLVKQRYDDLDVLIGINPLFSYDEYKNMNLFKYQNWNAAVQIPIYLELTPVVWFSVFGGLNYRYSYNYNKYNGSRDYQNYFSSDERTLNSYSSSQKSSTFSSSSNIFAGMVLRHKSGIQIQAAFRGDLAAYTNWNISMGYVFN